MLLIFYLFLHPEQMILTERIFGYLELHKQASVQ